jgi:uncharacterized MAPEG superfamily protein
MTTPFLCVLLAAVLIYLPRGFVIAGQVGRPEGLDNRHPRDQQAKLEGWARRAHAAHLNTLEAFPVFAAGVLIAHLSGADPGWSSRLSIVFVVARVIYPFIYMADVDKLRTAVWTVGFLAALGLYVLPWLA